MTHPVLPITTPPGKHTRDDCERVACGLGSMTVVRDTPQADGPWTRVLNRRCGHCGATTTQYVWAVPRD